MATSLEELEKIGPVDPEIIGLQAIIKKEQKIFKRHSPIPVAKGGRGKTRVPLPARG